MDNKETENKNLNSGNGLNNTSSSGQNMTLVPEEDDKYIGRVLDDRYEIVSRAGYGGMAVVYKALSRRLNRYDAIKILRDDLTADEESRKRFRDESKAIAMLSHPNIVAVYDVGQSEGIDYIVMELVDGITLKQYCENRGSLDWKETLHFSTQIVKALAHAHEKGIIHRDIKPQNVMVLKDGTIKVADFGIAELQNSLTGSSGTAVGSIHYMAPEQAKGAVADARSDIYSLGIVMYEMLTGQLPYTGNTPEEIAIKHINGKPVKPRQIKPEIPERMEQIVLKAMSSDLQNRYQTANEMLDDLEKFRREQLSLEGGTGEFPIQTTDTELLDYNEIASSESHEKASDKSKRKRSRSVAVLSGTLGVILLCIAVFVFLWQFFLHDLFMEAQKYEIPNFVGSQYQDIINDKQYKGIYNFTIEIELDTTHDSGYVLRQSPEAGREMALVQDGINVDLVVASGFTQVEVPNIEEGKYSEAEVEKILTDAGFQTAIETASSDTVAQGYVIGTSPSAGDKIDIGSTVYIIVSSGPATKSVKVPNLIGKTEEEAKTLIEDSGLLAGPVTYVEQTYEDESLYGKVIWQSAKADTEVEEGTYIYLRVAVRKSTSGTAASSTNDANATGSG
jgi:serine/threonine protein kinase